ncbi:637_t:CDS:10 [Entrophospora sp. SA101]|nr:637_t:CDS:10 [Entrophospora sp. SA101]
MSQNQNLIIPVDTQIDSALEENEPQVTPTETTSLLENAEPFRRYSHFPSNDSNNGNQHPKRPFVNRRHTWNPSQIRKLTAPITHYKRRSGFYDEDKHELVREGGGIRVWYDDYTTIDWIHDYIKERVRVRKLYSRKGFSGWVIKSWDGLQGWILVFLIGIVVACVAGIVDVTAEWGSDLKDGYCSNGITLKKQFCCKNQKPESCAEWVEWSSAFKMEDPEKSAWFNYFAYVFIAFWFAVGSALLVKYNSLYASPSSKRSIRSNNDSQKSRQPKPYASGSGIPEVKTILSGFVIRGFLGIRTLWVKAIALAMAVSSGMTLGKEGPFVHIACCVGNVISRLFHKYNKNEGKRREILSASAAAGVSVAFAAPIGGVLFSLEEVSYYFPSKTLCRSFFCAIVAAVSLKLIDPFGTGKIVMFQVKYDKDWHFFEIGSFLILGILGGLFGALLCKCIVLYTKYIRNGTRLKQWPIIEVAMVVILTSSLNYLNPFTKISNTDLVANLFSECSDEKDSLGLCVYSAKDVYPIFHLLAVALMSKFLTCIITFGIRTPAGIFIPALLIGACFGRMLGLVVQWLTLAPNDCVIPGVYAMVGAAASLAGVTRMTVSLTVIMFELTGALTYVLPIMTSIMISKWVADGFVHHGIYNLLIDLNEHPFLDANAEYIQATNTFDLTQKDLEVIDVNDLNTVAISGYSDTGFPIIDNNMLVGYIASTELEHALNDLPPKYDATTRCYFKEPEFSVIQNPDKSVDFTVYMDQAPLTVSKNSSLEVILELFKKLGLRYVCVTENGQYVGVIHKKWLLRYLKEMEGKKED